MCLDRQGDEPVEDDEIIYRRIPVSTGWYSQNGLSPQAFDARDDELTGISFCRAKYNTVEDAAAGPSKKGYYVASFRVGELRKAGILVEQRPCKEVAGHTELPQFTCETNELNETLELRSLLASLAIDVQGPFLKSSS